MKKTNSLMHSLFLSSFHNAHRFGLTELELFKFSCVKMFQTTFKNSSFGYVLDDFVSETTPRLVACSLPIKEASQDHIGVR